MHKPHSGKIIKCLKCPSFNAIFWKRLCLYRKMQQAVHWIGIWIKIPAIFTHSWVKMSFWICYKITSLNLVTALNVYIIKLQWTDCFSYVHIWDKLWITADSYIYDSQSCTVTPQKDFLFSHLNDVKLSDTHTNSFLEKNSENL